MISPCCASPAIDAGARWRCPKCGHTWRKGKFEGMNADAIAKAMAEESRKELAALEARRKPPWSS
jgi:ribosomal protein L37AE/L43A